MAITDYTMVFGASQALTSVSASSTSLIGSTIDLGASGKNSQGTTTYPDLGIGGMYLNIVCEDQDFASAGSHAVTAYLTGGTTASLSTSTVTMITTTLSASATDGDLLFSGQVPANLNSRRYVGLTVKVATAKLTGGKITAWLSDSPMSSVSNRV